MDSGVSGFWNRRHNFSFDLILAYWAFKGFLTIMQVKNLRRGTTVMGAFELPMELNTGILLRLIP